MQVCIENHSLMDAIHRSRDHHCHVMSWAYILFWLIYRSSEAPEVKSIETGDYTFDLKRGLLTWTIPEVNIDNNRGSLDFSVPELDPDSFFPINITFTSSQLFSGLHV
jgi:hypothetical protein